jgi:hypothetical protein
MHQKGYLYFFSKREELHFIKNGVARAQNFLPYFFVTNKFDELEIGSSLARMVI